MAMGNVSQSIVREFYSLVQPHLASKGPWTLRQDRQQWSAVLQARPLPPLCPGGTFTCNHRQQAIAVANVCERFLEFLVDSGILSQGWRHWPVTWMQEGAPDVLRFLMLTFALTVPGWVGRKTLLKLRGIPNTARQTAHAVLDQLVQQGVLQENPANKQLTVARRQQPNQQQQQQPWQQQQPNLLQQQQQPSWQQQPPPPSSQQQYPAPSVYQQQQQEQGYPQQQQQYAVPMATAYQEQPLQDPYQQVYQQPEQAAPVQQQQYVQQQYVQQQPQYVQEQYSQAAPVQQLQVHEPQYLEQQAVQVVYVDGSAASGQQLPQPLTTGVQGQQTMQPQHVFVGGGSAPPTAPQMVYQQQVQEPVAYQLPEQQQPQQPVTYVDANAVPGGQLQMQYVQQPQQQQQPAPVYQQPPAPAQTFQQPQQAYMPAYQNGGQVYGVEQQPAVQQHAMVQQPVQPQQQPLYMSQAPAAPVPPANTYTNMAASAGYDAGWGPQAAAAAAAGGPGSLQYASGPPSGGHGGPGYPQHNASTSRPMRRAAGSQYAAAGHVPAQQPGPAAPGQCMQSGSGQYTNGPDVRQKHQYSGPASGGASKRPYGMDGPAGAASGRQGAGTYNSMPAGGYGHNQGGFGGSMSAGAAPPPPKRPRAHATPGAAPPPPPARGPLTAWQKQQQQHQQMQQELALEQQMQRMPQRGRGSHGREASLGSSQPGYYQRQPPGPGTTSGARPGPHMKQQGGPKSVGAGAGGGGRAGAAGKQQGGQAAGGAPAAAAGASAGKGKGQGQGSTPGASQSKEAPDKGPAATGTAAAAAAVMAAAPPAGGKPGAAAAAAAANKSDALLHMSQRERQQQRLQQASEGRLTPDTLRRLVVAELCDAAPCAIKVKQLRQRYETRMVQQEGGGAGEQVRDVPALLAHLKQEGRAEVFSYPGKTGTVEWFVRWLDDDWAAELTASATQEAAA